jgi:hypothetical protein
MASAAIAAQTAAVALASTATAAAAAESTTAAAPITAVTVLIATAAAGRPLWVLVPALRRSPLLLPRPRLCQRVKIVD